MVGGCTVFVFFMKSGDCVEGRGGQASLPSVLSALIIIAEILSFNLQL